MLKTIGLYTSEIWLNKKFFIYFLWSIKKFVLTNHVQLLLYISYEQSDLYMLVSTKALLVATTSALEILNVTFQS